MAAVSGAAHICIFDRTALSALATHLLLFLQPKFLTIKNHFQIECSDQRKLHLFNYKSSVNIWIESRIPPRTGELKDEKAIPDVLNGFF